MNANEDEDILLQRASSALLAQLQILFEKIIWKSHENDSNPTVHERDLINIIAQIEPFQGDPQLLDTHLKAFIPPLVSTYLAHLESPPAGPAAVLGGGGSIILSNAICQILNVFCKVRGEKVIKGFFNNEPRYLEPLLTRFEKNNVFTQQGSSPNPQPTQGWEERYILLLWLSHLMLAPFPLESISSSQSTQDLSQMLKMDLPPQISGIALRILPICVRYLNSASKERTAAATLLVKLCLRPDMRNIGLLGAVIRWSLSFFDTASENLSDIHQCLGMLLFLSNLVTSATREELGAFMQDIYVACQRILDQNTLTFIRSSAVARRLVIKTLRNILVHCLQTDPSIDGFDTSTLLEEVIQFLLETMGDTDTPVRFAASKALSIITLKLEPEMASEVIEAIIGCLNEDVIGENSSLSFSSVDPLRWHGLTLTLSHLLFRRAVSTDQLPDVINALLSALTFEQRSSTGGSLGTNVRDAACFGIWALSRRYITKDLLSVETSSIKILGMNTSSSVPNLPQLLAIQLVASACLDPAGNIRRGSSAALQELVGRHPDIIAQGIPLVQTVDFHAVGLRQRALQKVTVSAAALDQIYWSALFEGILGWRGVGSLDTQSRSAAANAVGLLGRLKPSDMMQKMGDRICLQLESLSLRDVEERHGLVLSLASLVDNCSTESNLLSRSLGLELFSIEREPNEFGRLTRFWKLLDSYEEIPSELGHTSNITKFKLPDESFISVILRPELTTVAVCSLLSALAGITHQLHSPNDQLSQTPIPIKSIVHYLDLCLSRNEDMVLQSIPSAAKRSMWILDRQQQLSLVNSWLTGLEKASSHVLSKSFGKMIALGAVYSSIGPGEEADSILQSLTIRCGSQFDIQTRVVALQSLKILLEGIELDIESPYSCMTISKALEGALNDYTVNDRGDVGSLVRLEAMNAMESAWKLNGIRSSEESKNLYAAVVRLSLEKLDKLRNYAAHCLEAIGKAHFERDDTNAAESVSSYAYFAASLKLLTTPDTSNALRQSILEGLVSSAAGGSESVVQASRLALVDAFDNIPITRQEGGNEYTLLDVANILLDILKDNLLVDRITIPLLEVIGFLLDVGGLEKLSGVGFKWRTLLSLVMKAHFKSSNLHRLRVALDVYRGLAEIDVVRDDVLKKLAKDMLTHKFAKVRVSAAETLFMATGSEDLKWYDWSRPPKDLRPAIEAIQKNVIQQQQQQQQ